MNSAETTASRSGPSIALIVDDDRDTAEIYERLLSNDGWWVTSCSEREAFEYAHGVEPDLILSDVDVRPGASGPGVLQRLREDPLFRGLPVVLVAASSPDAPTAAHVDLVLVKPVEPRQLLESVRAMLQQTGRTRSRTLRESVAAVLARSQRAIAPPEPGFRPGAPESPTRKADLA